MWGWRRADQGEETHVEADHRNGLAVGGPDGFQQSRALEPGDAWRLDEMAPGSVAREGCPVKEQDPLAKASQQQRGRSAGTARANHNHIVHDLPPLARLVDLAALADPVWLAQFPLEDFARPALGKSLGA